MRKVHVAEGASLIYAAFQRPAAIEFDPYKTVSVPSRDGRPSDQDGCCLRGIDHLQLQGVAVLDQSKSESAAEVSITCSKGIAVAVQIPTADSAEVEAVQGWLHQTVRSGGPAERTWFDLFEDQQFPVGCTDGLRQDRKSLLLKGFAVKQCSG